MSSLSAPRAFRSAISEATVASILDRLRTARWPVLPDVPDPRSGPDPQRLRRLVAYWIADYDWAATETAINEWPQFIATVEGLDIHFRHVRSGTGGYPLILTHGWPGSFLEFDAVIEPLLNAGFDLVIPSIPGFAYSAKPAGPIGPRRIAGLWRRLMTDHLGYRRFGAQGGDWGSEVSTWLGTDHSDVVTGIHLNMVSGWRLPPNASPEALAWRRAMSAVRSEAFGYHAVQSTRPLTLSYALSDSPLGFAAWGIEKFEQWSDPDCEISDDALVTALMVHLVNDATGSMSWIYAGHRHEAALESGAIRVETPTAVARFAHDFFPQPPRSMVEDRYRVVRWTEMDRGGHFAAMEAPEALSRDIVAFFRELQ
ncbi:epoxide hydrolase family protein [Brevundimonas vesicularis]|uniref:Enterotoxin n=1 Tax=Brevundimonas vesicularis TaxID=41276 RepID=A0A1Z3U6K7_BREVE|nr:epoxide hydrolase family protein [Brevundimonas vesicularis]ASE38902.1 enterotoxin [Brevundimonas vesicularis]